MNNYPERYPSVEDLKGFLRDTKTTEYHEEIIQKATDVLQTIPEVDCILLMGSLGKGEGDIFSDIDFYVIHEGNKEDSQSLKSKMLRMIDENCEVLYGYTTGFQKRDNIIFMNPLVKFELNIRSAEESVGNWKYAKTRILYDPKGIGKRLQEDAEEIIFTLDQILPWLSNSAIFLPTMFYLASSFVVRGEYATAMDGVDWIRSEMLRISGWLLGQWDEGPRRAETRFPSEILSYYWDSRVLTPKEIFQSTSILMDWYETWMVPRFEELEIPHSGYQVKILREVVPTLEEKTRE